MLTETGIRSAKPKSKPYKVADGDGLYLLVNPNKSRWWRFKYRVDGKEKLLSLGVYPDVSLKLAREKRDEARKQLANGINPSEHRQATKQARADSFKAVADEWLELQTKKLSPVTLTKAKWLLGLVLPSIGSKPIGDLKAPELLRALRKIEKDGRNETTHRVKQRCGQVFRYGIATGRCDHNIAADLKDALAPVVTTHHAAITKPAAIGELLRAIGGFAGQPSTVAALKLMPLVFTRPGELRQACWEEFDLEAALWVIPATRMKMRAEHSVPLSKQAVAILRELHRITGTGRLVFPGIGNRERPISENTINSALRRLGYGQDEMCSHGFRTLASTTLNSLGWNADIIEAQLAHQDKNSIRRIYNRADHLAERKKLMQSWADHLDALRTGAKVIPIKRGA
jgi:integrase